jgi:hypothetical protein
MLRCPTCLSLLLEGDEKRCPACHSRLRKRTRPIVLGESTRIQARPVMVREQKRSERADADPRGRLRHRARKSGRVVDTPALARSEAEPEPEPEPETALVRGETEIVALAPVEPVMDLAPAPDVESIVDSAESPPASRSRLRRRAFGGGRRAERRPPVDRESEIDAVSTVPVAEPMVEPVADVIVEPVADVIVEPMVEPVVEPVADVIVEPVAEPVVEPVADAAPPAPANWQRSNPAWLDRVFNGRRSR